MVLDVNHRFGKCCVEFFVTQALILIYFRELLLSHKKKLTQRFQKPVFTCRTIQVELSKLDTFTP